MTYSLKGKIAVVTGASQGLGRDLSYRLALDGAEVLGVARSEDKLKELQYNIGNKGGNFSYKALDLLKDGIPESFIKDVYDEHGGFEVLVNNAGMLEIDHLCRYEDLGKLDNVVKLNATVPLHLYHSWIKDYIDTHSERKPEVGFNMSSISALYAWGGGASYQMSKSGLSALISALRAMQNELKEVPVIRYATLYPDTIDTEMAMTQEGSSGRKLKQEYFLKAGSVVDTAMSMIKGEGICSGNNDIAIVANPAGYERGVYLVLMPTDEETGRPMFNSAVLKNEKNVVRLGGEALLTSREDLLSRGQK